MRRSNRRRPGGALPGCCTPEQIIETTASMGFGVSNLPPRQWDAIRDAGLRIVCVRGHDDITDGLNDPAQHDRIEREILANLELAQQLRHSVAGLLQRRAQGAGRFFRRGQYHRGTTAGVASGRRGRRAAGAGAAEQQGQPQGLHVRPHGLGRRARKRVGSPASSCSTTSTTCRSWKAT